MARGALAVKICWDYPRLKRPLFCVTAQMIIPIATGNNRLHRGTFMPTIVMAMVAEQRNLCQFRNQPCLERNRRCSDSVALA